MDSFSSEHDHCCQPAPATSSNSQERVRHVSKKLPQIPEEETARFPTSSQAYQEQRQALLINTERTPEADWSQGEEEIINTAVLRSSWSPSTVASFSGRERWLFWRSRTSEPEDVEKHGGKTLQVEKWIEKRRTCLLYMAVIGIVVLSVVIILAIIWGMGFFDKPSTSVIPNSVPP